MVTLVVTLVSAVAINVHVTLETRDASETTVADFPNGCTNTVITMQEPDFARANNVRFRNGQWPQDISQRRGR